MKKNVFVLLVTATLSVFANAATVYSEDFSTDPGFTTSKEFGIAGQADSATWNSSGEWYQVHLKEYGGGTYNGAAKFAVTPTFSRIANQSFSMSFDMYYDHASFGMGVDIMAIDGEVRSKEDYSGHVIGNAALVWYYGGNDSGSLGYRMHLMSPSTITYTPNSNVVNKGIWYSHSLSYDSTTEMIDYVITERSTGNVFYTANQVLPIGSFDRLAFGHSTMFYDGTSSELWIDNIVVSKIAPTKTIEVVVDIKPGSCVNPLNIGSRGVLPVAVLGTKDVNVLNIDALTIQLAGVNPNRTGYEDVGTPAASEEECATDLPDGILDLVLKFDTQAILEVIGEVADGEEIILELTGLSNDDTPIIGQDYVTIRAKGEK